MRVRNPSNRTHDSPAMAPQRLKRQPQRITSLRRFDAGSTQPDLWTRRRPVLLGLGALLSALAVLLWPGSLIQLALGALGLALALLLVLVVALMVRRAH